MKPKESTKWQAAFILHALTILIAYLIYYCNPEYINWDEKWNYIGNGFCIGCISWFFPLFDYVKRDGSFENCLIAFVLLPLTMYYGVYKSIYMCINLLKKGARNI